MLRNLCESGRSASPLSCVVTLDKVRSIVNTRRNESVRYCCDARYQLTVHGHDNLLSQLYDHNLYFALVRSAILGLIHVFAINDQDSSRVQSIL